MEGLFIPLLTGDKHYILPCKLGGSEIHLHLQGKMLCDLLHRSYGFITGPPPSMAEQLVKQRRARRCSLRITGRLEPGGVGHYYYKAV